MTELAAAVPVTVTPLSVVAGVCQVPGDPTTVHTQAAPDWSISQSPAWKVPVTGAPAAVAPTYRDGAVAPVRPRVDRNPVQVPLASSRASWGMVTTSFAREGSSGSWP